MDIRMSMLRQWMLFNLIDVVGMVSGLLRPELGGPVITLVAVAKWTSKLEVRQGVMKHVIA